MSINEYSAIWEQTNKAASYLRRKGARYWTAPVDSGLGSLRLIRYVFADVSDKARDHVAKAYPKALVAFDAAANVDHENAHIEAAFRRVVAHA